MRSLAFAAALTIGLAAGTADAAVTVFSDKPTWLASAGTITATEDFSDLAFVNGLVISKGSLGSGVWNDVVDPPTMYSFNAVTAVGFDLDMGPGGFGTGQIYTVHFVGGGTHVLPEINDYIGFYGVVSSTPFDKLTISAGTACCVETYTLDNMTFGAIPEAGTWAMLIVGFGVVGTSMRRRRDMLAA